MNDARSVKNIPRGERPGKIGRTRLPVEAWVERLSPVQRRELLGKGRAELLDSGRVTSLTDLVDSATGRPLRLDQLPRAL